MSRGREFEALLAQKLADAGFFVQYCNRNSRGQQSCDMIAVRGGKAYLIDAKDCQSGAFQRRRIEANQSSASWLWQECGNGKALLAFRDKTGQIWFEAFDGSGRVSFGAFVSCD